MLSAKNPVGPAGRLGFDDVSDARPAGSEKWVARLRDRPPGQPFFCWSAAHDAHRAFTITDEAPGC